MSTQGGTLPRMNDDGPARVLVVDDEAGVRNAVARVLRKAGMLPSVAEGGTAALVLLERERFDVVLLDVRMPGMTGWQLLSRIKAERHPVEVIMMTALADLDAMMSAAEHGAYAVVTKPFATIESLVEIVSAAACKDPLEQWDTHVRRKAESGRAHTEESATRDLTAASDRPPRSTSR